MHFLGVAGMPRRIPDYPDAYFIFNKIASWGSYVSAISSLFFFYIVFTAFSTRGVKRSEIQIAIERLSAILYNTRNGVDYQKFFTHH